MFNNIVTKNMLRNWSLEVLFSAKFHQVGFNKSVNFAI